MSKKYATEFICDFNLVLYPFDDQYCDMQLKISSASKDYLVFDNLTSLAVYLGNPLLLEYEVRLIVYGALLVVIIISFLQIPQIGF